MVDDDDTVHPGIQESLFLWLMMMMMMMMMMILFILASRKACFAFVVVDADDRH